MRIVAGVDEAGRGCVIGPLVVAGVAVEEKHVEDLMRLGVRDSKQLTPARREALSIEISTMAKKITYFEISPMAIDKVVSRGVKLRRLNYLEAMAMAKVIRDLEPHRVFIDPSDVLPDRFSEQIIRVLRKKPKVICEHHADEKYTIVSAASIMAKVRRDRIVSELRRKYGDFGSGYPNDDKTISFLKCCLKDEKSSPSYLRYSWITVKNIREL